MEQTYKEFKISYEEHNDSWKGVNGNITLRTNKGLAELKKTINAHLKKESKFKNMAAIDAGSYGNRVFRKITITSVTDVGEVCIRDERGNREKHSACVDIYVDNEENWGTISEIKDKETMVSDIKAEIEDLKEALIKLDIPKYND